MHNSGSVSLIFIKLLFWQIFICLILFLCLRLHLNFFRCLRLLESRLLFNFAWSQSGCMWRWRYCTLGWIISLWVTGCRNLTMRVIIVLIVVVLIEIVACIRCCTVIWVLSIPLLIRIGRWLGLITWVSLIIPCDWCRIRRLWRISWSLSNWCWNWRYVWLRYWLCLLIRLIRALCSNLHLLRLLKELLLLFEELLRHFRPFYVCLWLLRLSLIYIRRHLSILFNLIGGNVGLIVNWSLLLFKFLNYKIVTDIKWRLTSIVFISLFTVDLAGHPICRLFV